MYGEEGEEEYVEQPIGDYFEMEMLNDFVKVEEYEKGME